MRTDSPRAQIRSFNRRGFLKSAFAGSLAAGFAWVHGRNGFAETQLAARIAEAPASHPILPALKKAAQGLEALKSVKDYQATLIRQELVGSTVSSSQLEIKLRHEPFSVYVKYLDPSAGREVIYVEGKNEGKLQVHETGFASLVGTLSLDPKGKLAMDGNRYPVTMIGIRKMAELTIEEWLTLAKRDDVTVNYYASAKSGDVPCHVFETIVAKDVPGLKCNTVRLYFNASTGLPIRVQALGLAKDGETPPVIEDYFYSDLKTNVGLADIDFDVENAKYGF